MKMKTSYFVIHLDTAPEEIRGEGIKIKCDLKYE